MLKRASGARTRVLLVGGAVVLGAMIQLSAFADAPTLTAHITDVNGDGWVNSTEVSAVPVTGTYQTGLTPAIDDIVVQIVNDPSCSLGAPQITNQKHAALDAGTGTWSTAGFDVSSFSEGATLCARVRASTNGGASYGDLVTSDNQPVKDTVIVPGTVELTDPNGDGYLNSAEYAGHSVHTKWLANSDLQYAATWITGCGAEPATIGEDPSGDVPIDNACVDTLAQYSSITFNVVWKDAAGNTTLPKISNALTKDTDPPTISKVAINTSPLNKANIRAVKVSGDIRNRADGVPENERPVSIWVTDNTKTVYGSATSDGIGKFVQTLNLESLHDGVNNITAHAMVTDPAGNVSAEAVSSAVSKDATPPDAPVVTINPKPIDRIHQKSVEVTVSGELGTEVVLRVQDDDSHSIRFPKFGDPPIKLNGTPSAVVPVDVSGLTDGLITASAVLTDSLENDSNEGIDTARKDTTGPAITITTPAIGAKTQGARVLIAGTAEKDAKIVLTEGKTRLNPNELSASDNGYWSYLASFKSGSHTVVARVTNPDPGSVGAVTADRTFDVDGDAPVVTIDTTNNAIFQPGDDTLITGSAEDKGLFKTGVLGFKAELYGGFTPSPGSVPPVKQTVRTVNITCEECPGPNLVDWSYDTAELAPGYYTLRIFSVDTVGNTPAQPATVSFLKL